MEWRRKWARNWEQVKYCSDACRRRRDSGPAEDLERAVLALLEGRARDATICPSEAARKVAGETGGDGGSADRRDEAWRDLMEPAREAARRLAAREVVVFRQGGRVVDPSTAKGPVRIGRGPGWNRR